MKKLEHIGSYWNITWWVSWHSSRNQPGEEPFQYLCITLKLNCLVVRSASGGDDGLNILRYFRSWGSETKGYQFNTISNWNIVHTYWQFVSKCKIYAVLCYILCYIYYVYIIIYIYIYIHYIYIYIFIYYMLYSKLQKSQFLVVSFVPLPGPLGHHCRGFCQAGSGLGGARRRADLSRGGRSSFRTVWFGWWWCVTTQL